MKHFVMMVGLPGTGKSTFAKELVQSGYPLIDTDSYIERIAKEKGVTYNKVFQDAIGLASKNIFKNLEKALNLKSDIVWDQTNLNRYNRELKLAKIPEDYFKTAVVFHPSNDWDIMLKREGKVIPSDVLNKMINSFDCPTLEENFHEIQHYKVINKTMVRVFKV